VSAGAVRSESVDVVDVGCGLRAFGVAAPWVAGEEVAACAFPRVVVAALPCGWALGLVFGAAWLRAEFGAAWLSAHLQAGPGHGLVEVAEEGEEEQHDEDDEDDVDDAHGVLVLLGVRRLLGDPAGVARAGFLDVERGCGAAVPACRCRADRGGDLRFGGS
jgi:hypothetical protein